ncbi:MAG TPA: PH domain-containing protein [Pseudomonadales bacterium]|nr:PH domain-containing protein [Pseudomonadales bacterium]
MIDFDNKTVFKLKQSPDYAEKVQALLLPGEEVLDAFQSMRDGVVFTSKRIIAINVQGLTGSKKDFTSLPYAKMTAFSIETAGTFDLDAELQLYYSGLGKVTFEFKGSSNLTAIAKMIAAATL